MEKTLEAFWLLRKWFIAPVGGVGRIVAYVLLELTRFECQNQKPIIIPPHKLYVPVYSMSNVFLKLNRQYVGVELGHRFLDHSLDESFFEKRSPMGYVASEQVIDEKGLSCKYLYVKSGDEIMENGASLDACFVASHEVGFTSKNLRIS